MHLFALWTPVFLVWRPHSVVLSSHSQLPLGGPSGVRNSPRAQHAQHVLQTFDLSVPSPCSSLLCLWSLEVLCPFWDVSLANCHMKNSIYNGRLILYEKAPSVQNGAWRFKIFNESLRWNFQWHEPGPISPRYILAELFPDCKPRKGQCLKDYKRGKNACTTAFHVF